MGIAAGLCEETIFRGVTVPLGMRYLKSKNRMYIIVYASALIFGLMHIGNIVNGAKLSIALIQGIATIFGGFLFMALYLRTGSIWPSIIAHGIYDYMCFVTDPNLNEGIMVNEAVTTGLILTLVIYIVSGLWALYLICPAVKDKIEAVWNEKWSITDL